ncbi:TPM domain-containing protein [Hymenobacter sp. BT186]|uniref:TPM domain-containing protein n=1 Tax=Hymenobacter telluris TaxID=2816474 RepID=A0A939EVN1_9BACT|nr:TPM domain-containing protein [Hymenobacter telluris]MBO0358350.1 TPM domain-containing protein [Hymenobacter telluris]MBW3374376.1 TPM domain-containing protein [Hymenobacter norwichensis]
MLSRLLHLRILLVCLLLAACNSPSAPPSAPSYLTAIPDPKTLGETYVSDPDGVLSAATISALNDTLQALDQAGQAHIDVVLTNSIGDEVPKAAAHALFNHWQIGDPTKNNGLLILLVLDQRRIEFETGYGLEADLPDALCYRIQQRYMLPAARAGNYDQAVQQGVAATIRQLTTGSMDAPPLSDSARLDSMIAAVTQPQDQNYHLNNTPEVRLYAPAAETSSTSPLWSIGVGLAGLLALPLYLALWFFTTATSSVFRWLLAVALLLPVLLFVLAFSTDGTVSFWVVVGVAYLLPGLYLHGYLAVVNVLNRTKYAPQGRHAQHTYLHQMHYQLDFSAYVFPVLLAFYWPWHRRRMQHLRDTPYPCPTCAVPMHRLPEQTDDELLELGQVAEEMIESVDYDVWQCQQCQQKLVLGYRNLASDVEPCPACQHRTYRQKRRRVMQAATTSSPGWGLLYFQCEYCGHKHEEKFTIAQLSTSSRSSSGSSFSSGSSSSSSSSSSSGGSSGGGGAGSSW